MKKSILVLVLLIGIAVCSCNLFNSHHNNQITENTPVITNVEDAYTYTVNGDAFSDSTREALVFSSNEAVLTYTILDYSAGTIILDIDNADTLLIYNDTINGNAVIVEDVNEKPCFIKLVFDNFSGMFELALAED
ncbi:MAG: hypothetical protein JW794_07695 [Candidatus Cloacimonetes bacterium]|nr:hypothetical protein [Candidatus Cloacimonadota bacterium]